METSDDIQIRLMTEADVAAVLAIESTAYEYPWTRGIFDDCLRVGYSCWVLTIETGIAGYGILSAAAGEAHLMNLCVSPDQQGRGLGRRLLKRMLDVARLYQASTLFLEVRPSNLAAIALYQSDGFDIIGRRPGYYPANSGAREDAVVMSRRLLAAAPASVEVSASH